MLRIKKLSDVIGKKVFTDAGDLFGVVEEVNLVDNKIDGWRIVVDRARGMLPMLGGARGIIIPHQFMKAIGDVVLINKDAVPAAPAEPEVDLTEVEEELM